MKRLLFSLSLLTCFTLAADKPQGPIVRPNGLWLNTAADQPLSFYGAIPTERPTSANQTALTDNTGGSVANATLASTAGISILSVPVQLASMTTSAADLVTEILPGYKFKVLGVDFVTTTLGTGSGASQTINLEIGTTNLTGGWSTRL